jgi:hypothetical protein
MRSDTASDTTRRRDAVAAVLLNGSHPWRLDKKGWRQGDGDDGDMVGFYSQWSIFSSVLPSAY